MYRRAINPATIVLMTMRYSDEELRDRLTAGEDSDWEFKQVRFRGDHVIRNQRDTWAEEMVAFANSSGGCLLLGVTDDGKPQGLSPKQLNELELMIVELCRDSITPPIIPLTHKCTIDGHRCLLVEIESGYALHEHKGQSFIRVGSSKRLMNSEQRIRLTLRRGQAQRLSFDESPVANTGFATLHEHLWKPLLSADQHAEPAVGLEKLALLTDDEHGTRRASVAGVLLCTDHPEDLLQQAVITATSYRGGDESTGQLDTQTITGPLNQQVADAVAFVRRNMRVGAIKDPARLDMPEYSMQAVFEGLVNAVAHRDYMLRGMRIRLRMFNDRLEICSPGALPNGMTIEQMASLQATRNVAVTSNLSRMPVASVEGSEERRYFMETRGDGVMRIQRATQALTGRMPRFEVINDVELRLTIPAATPASDSFRTHVHVRSDRGPVIGADVLVLFPNGTYRQAVTDQLGDAAIELYTGNLPMTVYVAAPELAGGLVRAWIPSETELVIELTPLPGGGSVIIPEGRGSIPMLKGNLNPILDNLDRTYLYASNVAINEGQAQPVTFRPGDEELTLVDSAGNCCYLRILAIAGNSSLVEYRPG